MQIFFIKRVKKDNCFSKKITKLSKKIINNKRNIYKTNVLHCFFKKITKKRKEGSEMKFLL